ncbi:hypothetical protein QZR43_26330 [Serratia marcescens]|uniref:hypothetical protein n=1 Tax=Serratia marcescens TaxID=615 RepID=UPI00276AD681|nr:hypothetical protein [Serratia marcescens]MDP8776076.1 hypothetical protein [Serratia marcescens]MDP8806497.1 hypothetical protein [Serratia marcescens]
MDNKLNELSKPVAWLAIYHGDVYDEAISITRSVVEAQAERFGWESALTEITPLYSQEYVSALLARIEELEWRELNSTELKELLTWHPTENSAATDPILWAAMRNKINLTRVRVASDEAKKEQSNG